MQRLFPILFSAGCALAVLMVPPARAADAWSDTLSQVAPSVVTIHVDATRAFDTEWNSSAQATGFVVDAERGIVLTNRHVVQPGPVTAQAVFQDHEEVDLVPIYRDPVHDFGFYKYDPSQLRYIHPVSLPLVPDAAKVGTQIRVVGNDAGEQLSILSGTLARLDREAPDYGRGKFNDFNTFYLQAASGTSGGSSGSPVLNIQGQVIGLNAGSRTDAASSFFLPLGRVVRALHLIQQGKPVTRGTLETTFVQQPFNELERLGLQQATEKAVRRRYPELTGMLVVDSVLPGGPAADELQPGDVLVKLGGRMVVDFDELNAALDAHVGSPVQVEVERGGTVLTLTLSVADLTAITPHRYLEFGGASLNTLSYQMARHINLAPKGVFVANPGYVLSTAGIGRGAVITSVNGKSVADVGAMANLIGNVRQGARMTLRYFDYDEPSHSSIAIVTMDWKWYPARFCHRDDETGLWPCSDLQPPSGAARLQAATAVYPSYGDPRAQRLSRSLVFVNFDMPYQIDGVDYTHYSGTGLVVDARRGLVIVDRNTVPVSLGDVRLTFAGDVEIPGRVVYVHPLHNLAVIAYDPALLDDTPVKSATFSPETLRPGATTWVVGFQPDESLVSQRTQIASIDPVRFPLSSTFRFRDTNLETASVVNAPDNVDGVLADSKGRVMAYWASFAYQSGDHLGEAVSGIPADLVRETANLARQGAGATFRSLGVEFYYQPLASARKMGLSGAWAHRLAALSGRDRHALVVDRLVAGVPAEHELQEGDLLLAVDGDPVNSFRGVEERTQKTSVELTVFRDGKIHTLEVGTVALDGRGTSRIVQWGGALLQRPHRALAAQRGIPRTGVFVAFFNYGSPASRYHLYPGRRIVAVDDQPTPDLDAFLRAVSGKRGRASVRLKLLDWTGKASVITLELDPYYWPAYEVYLKDGQWHRRALFSDGH